MSVIKKTAQSAFIIMVFTLVSKFLGFFREMLIASKFGGGATTDAFFIANTATVVIMAALGSGLNITLIPIFAEIGEKHGEKSKIKYLNNIINITFILTLILTVLGIVFSPLIIRVIASGFTGEQFELAVTLNRIGFSMVIFMILSFVLTSYLNSASKFTVAASVGIAFNVIYIIYLLFFSSTFGIKGLMVSVVIAYLSQVIIQLPAVRNMGYRFVPKIDLNDEYIKKVFMLIGPVSIGAVVRQINVVVDRTLASNLVEGSVSALNYADKLNSLTFSVFIVTIITVIFPMLSRESSKNDIKAIKEIMGYSINTIILVTMPVMAGLIVLATPIVRVLFERGAFDANATNMTAVALMFYSVGIVAYGLREMISKVFYSFHDTTTPMKNGIISVLLNIVLNIILVRFMGHGGLALATSISAIIATLMLFVRLRKKVGPIGARSYIECFIKTFVASIIMGIVVYFAYNVISDVMPQSTFGGLVGLGGAIGLGATVYFGACYLLKVRELKYATDMVMSKIRTRF